VVLRVIIGGLLLAALGGAADEAYESAARKIALIEEDRAAAGARIWISLKEVNAYAAVAALQVVPKGLRSPRLELGKGSAVAYANVDLLKVQELKASAPNPLLAWFLSGERPLEIKARIQSGQGRATVYVDEMRLSAVSARGVVLDFLVENFLLPFYPTAAIGRPFALKHSVDRLEVTPAGVTVVIAKPR
jgi:hypothetical protein